MLNLIFSSLCTGHSAKQTREILDSYAMRCGNGTWTSQMTKEGLATVRSALMRNASRNSAVACLAQDSRGQNLLWIVGKRKRFSSRGVSSVATGTHHLPGITRPFEMMASLRQISAHSGIRHDMGKANLFFKGKLARGLHLADPVRHEILSLLITDELLAHPGLSFDDAFKRAARRASKLNGGSAFIDFPKNERGLSRWVLATHHRLPKGEHGTAYYANHISPSSAKDVKACLTSAGDLLSDEDLAFRVHMTDKSLTTSSMLTNPAIEGAFIWSRLAMMMGDHHASQSVLPEGCTGIFANTETYHRPAQDLAQHLIATEKFSDKSGWVLHHLEDRLPALYPEDRREIMKPSPAKLGFGWQNTAVNAARHLSQQPNARNSGTFVVLCASTGSGKTRAGFKIASALSGEKMRLTTLLGLRSLTMQTGDAYAAEADISRDNLAVLIGSREVRKLHEAEKKKNEKNKTGDADLYIETTVDGGFAVDLPGVVQSQMQRDDDNRMLCSPVLVCTIDYLMAGADWRKAQHILPQLRLMTSDVILDEIDGYGLEDYAAIGRLCYLVGLFGRKLIFSSATAMPEIVAPLYKAYEAGWKAYSAITGCKDTINTLFIADSVAPVKLSAPATFDIPKGKEHWFKSRYQAFTESVAQALLELPVLRRGFIASVSKMPDLISTMETLHQENHDTSALEPSVRVSCGLIRLARVKDTAAVATALVRMGPELLKNKGIFVKVVAYHSNLPLAVRAWVESYLDKILKRKPGNPDPITHNSIAREAKEHGAKHAIILVVATPVEEVGRDHDFDWAFIEPSSSRSIVQCSGRVNRHRRKLIAADQRNIAVMDRNLRDLEGQERSFWGPGFESKTNRFPDHTITAIAPHLVSRPDAEACLSASLTDKLPEWERAIIESTLESSISASFIRPLSAKLTDEHFERHPFRSGMQPTEVYYSYPDKRWKTLDTGINVAFDPVSIFPSEHWLIDIRTGLREIVEDVGMKLELDHMDEEFSKKYMRVGLSEYYFEKNGITKTHPLLGIYKETFKIILK